MSTAKDVAKLAGVSVTTVTRILNNDTRYSYKEETRSTVMDAAEKLEYTNVKKGKAAPKAEPVTETMNVLLISTHAITVLIEGVQQACDELGYNLLIRISDRAEDEEYVPYLENNSVKAVIFFDYVSKSETLEKYKDILFVQINEYSINPSMTSITIDELRAVHDIAGFLIEKGRTRIVMACYNYAHEKSVPLMEQRRLGLEASLAHAGYRLRPDFCLVDSPTATKHREEEQHIFKELKKLLQLDSEERPDGIICNGARLAALCLRVVQETGLRVPEDVALVCCSSDDYTSLNVLEVTNPTISGVLIPLREMGCEAVYTIKTMLERPNARFNGIVLPYGLVYRESTPK